MVPLIAVGTIATGVLLCPCKVKSHILRYVSHLRVSRENETFEQNIDEKVRWDREKLSAPESLIHKKQSYCRK